MGGPRRVDNEAKVGTWRRGGEIEKKQDERKQRTKKRRKKNYS